MSRNLAPLLLVLIGHTPGCADENVTTLFQDEPCTNIQGHLLNTKRTCVTEATQ